MALVPVPSSERASTAASPSGAAPTRWSTSAAVMSGRSLTTTSALRESRAAMPIATAALMPRGGS